MLSRAARLLGRAMLVMVGLILLGGLVLVLAGDRIYPRLLEAAARSGAELTVSARGPVTLQLWPAVRVTAADLGVVPAGPTARWDAQLPDTRLEFAGRPLLRGRLVLEKLEIRGARVRIGRGVGTESHRTDPASALVSNLVQAHIRIDDARIEIAGATAPKRHTVQLDHYVSGPGPGGHPHVQARGTIDGSALSVDGRFGARAERVGNVAAFPLTASVSVPDWKLKGTVAGHLVRPLEGKGLAVETTLEIADVAPLARVLDLPGALTGGAQLNAKLDGDLPSPRLVQVKATLKGGDALSASVEGAGIDVASGDIESLRFALDGPLPASVTGKLEAVHHVSAEGSVKGGPGHYKVTLERAQVEMTGETQAEANGTLDLAALDDWAFTDSQLQVKASTPSVAALSRLLGDSSLPEIGPGELHGQLTGALTTATFEESVIRIGGQGPVQITARGKIGPLALGGSAKAMAAAETDLRVEVTVDDREVLQRTFAGGGGGGAAALAPWARAVHHLSAEASLKGGPGHYTVKVKRARIAMAGKTQAEANGTLELAALDDWAFTDSQLQVKASTASVAALSRLLGNDSLPELGPGELHGQLTGALTAATLEELVVRIGGQGPARISAKGKIGPLHLDDSAKAMERTETDLRMEVTVNDSKVLQAYLGRELATLKPWTGQGRVRNSPQHWQLSDLEVKAGNKNDVLFEVSGEAKGRGELGAGVKRVVTVSPAKDDTVDLNVVLESADAQATGRALGVNVPELGALKGRARFQTETRTGGPRVLALRGLELQSTGELAMQLTGDIGSLSGFEDVNLELTLADTPPEVIDRLLDLELPLSGEVSLNGRLRRPGQQVLRVHGEARVGSSRLALQLTAERTHTVPLIKGQIHSTAIHSHDFSLADVPLAPVKQRRRKTAATGGLGLLGILPGIDFVLQDAVEQQEQAQQEDSKPVAPDPLPWTRLRHVDIDLNVHVDTVHGVHISGGPLDLRLVDRAGRLQFGPSTLTFKGGSVSIRGVADSNDTPPSLTVNGRGVRLRIDEIAANRGVKSAELAGQLTFDYELHSRGETLPELRAGLGGKIQALVEHGQFPLRNLDLLSGSLLEWLTTWVTSDKAAPVPCAVADFTINNGVAEVKTLYVKTDTSAAYGIGNIDLRADRLDLTVTPKVRGFSLSPPATIHIHGPLASPQVEVGNIAAVALRYGTEVIQGISFPPSLLLGHLFGKMATSEPGPCRRAGAK